MKHKLKNIYKNNPTNVICAASVLIAAILNFVYGDWYAGALLLCIVGLTLCNCWQNYNNAQLRIRNAELLESDYKSSNRIVDLLGELIDAKNTILELRGKRINDLKTIDEQAQIINQLKQKISYRGTNEHTATTSD
jgi:hypothetical protein